MARKFVPLSLLGSLSATQASVAGPSPFGGSSVRRGTAESEYTPPHENNDAAVAQTEIEEYELWPPIKFKEKLEEWAELYPDLIRVTTAQEKYGLPTAGEAGDCPFYTDSDGCPNYIFELQDYVVHPPESFSSTHLPEVFWSGCLHGNERVGPTAVMEATELILESAHCESLPRQGHSNSIEEQKNEAREAQTCRVRLNDKGIDSVHRKWLARLITTRRIVVVPTANALGYFRNRREEGKIDPNRDFPYDLDDPSLCMQTICGRTLNEVYREHLFQLALTFHGGMEAVAYEWGAPTWLGHLSPDDVAQDSIASAYSRFGGGFSTSKPYQYGNMNDVVYYVRGGMEDWAYAGSFDPERVVQCTPETFGGYPAEQTVYNNSTLRVFNMLVETSNDKNPRKKELGTSLDVLNRDTKGNGHVSRNIRLALLAAELVEPYVSIVGVNELSVQDDLPPGSSRSERKCQKQKAYSVAKDAKEVEIHFSVGGSMTINNVDIWFAKWDDIPLEQLDCISQPKSLDGFQKGAILGATNGTGYFSRAGSHPRTDGDSAFHEMTIGPIFKGKIDIPTDIETLDQLVVVASARVDQEWKNAPPNVLPQVGPQSHVVNARTDPTWHHESAGKHVVGRLDWFSAPLTIVLGDFSEGVGTHGHDGLVKTVEMYPRFSRGVDNSGIKPKSASNEQLWFPVNMWFVLAVLVLVLACCFYCTRGRSKGGVAYHQADDFSFGSKPYSDAHDDDELDDDDLNDGVELRPISKSSL